MLNLKKVIALVCVFAMMLTTVAFGATYSDVAEDSAYYEAVETLTKLGIVSGDPDGTYRPEDGVTRAEMAKLIACIQGYGETAKASANTKFADVPASHWASGYIANAAGMGIINGYGDGNFGPEDPVLYEQAVKMIMATLGYTPYAEYNGGYPTGYLAAAQRYDVSLVANAAVGSEANRGTIAQLLAKAIDTPLMVQTSWNTNGEVTYGICDGQDKALDYNYKTLMSENLGYIKVRGVIVDSGLVSIVKEGEKDFDTTDEAAVGMLIKDSYKTNNDDFDGIKANDNSTWVTEKLLTGTTDAADYLGRSVIGYIKKLATDKYELVSVAVDTNRDDVLVIDLDSYNDTTATQVHYYKDGASDVTKVNYEANMAVVYNNECVANGDTANGGTAAATAIDAEIGTTTPILYGGTMTLIDNDEKPGYNVAIIEAAATAVVKKATEDGLTFKNSIILPNNEAMGMLEIDPEDENKVVAIFKDGEMIEASELQEWDVLSIIAIKEDANVIVAEVISNQIVGTISGRKTSKTSAAKNGPTGYAYQIDGAYYDVAKRAYEADFNTLEVGVGGTFYIDKYGKIAAFDEDSSLATGVAANYGYIVKISSDDSLFAGYDVEVQIVTANGVEVLPLKDKAKINVKENDEATYTALKDADDDEQLTVDASKWTDDGANSTVEASLGDADLDNLEGQVVKYSLSGDEISVITLADHDDKDKFDYYSGLNAATATKKFDADDRELAGEELDADTLVFFVGGAGTTSVKDSYLGSLADLDDQNKYAVKGAYTNDGDVNILVIDAQYVTTNTTSSVAVIASVGDTTNEAEEEVYVIDYWKDGELAEGVYTAEKTTLGLSDTLSEGDIVKVKVGSDGVVSKITMVYNFSGDVRTAYNDSAATAYTNSIASTDSDNDVEIFAGGVVLDYNENGTKVILATEYSDTTVNKAYKLDEAVNVYVINGTGNTLSIKKGSTANFKVFEKLYDTNVTNVKALLGDVVIPGNTGATDLDTDGDGTTDAQSLTTRVAAQDYADHVYVRAYDGDVTDVVIVKTESDLKIR